MSVETRGRFFYVGEKPRPTALEYRVGGKLDGTYDGDTLTADCTNGAASPVTVPIANTGVGTFEIQWPTGTSVFTEKGTIECVIKAANAPYDEVLGVATFNVREP